MKTSDTKGLYHARRTGEENIGSVGSVISGIVERVTPEAIIVSVNCGGHMKGTISNEHLEVDLQVELLHGGEPDSGAATRSGRRCCRRRCSCYTEWQPRQ